MLSGTFLGGVNEYHRRVTAERTVEAKRRAVARGVAPFANLPSGYRRGDSGQIEPDPETAPVVAAAFAARAGGVPQRRPRRAGRRGRRARDARRHARRGHRRRCLSDAERDVDLQEQQLDAAVRAFNGLVDVDAARDRLLELREQGDRARDRLAELQTAGAPVMTISGSGDWNLLTLDERRALVVAVIARVVVAPGMAAVGSLFRRAASNARSPVEEPLHVRNDDLGQPLRLRRNRLSGCAYACIVGGEARSLSG